MQAANFLTSKRASPEAGFTLIEVLVALVVLSIGLLGMAALQIHALRNNQSSFQRTQAVMLSYYIFDAMRANRKDVGAGTYNLAKTCNLSDVPPSDTLVGNDLHDWIQALKTNIGNVDTTCGQISCANMTCTATVFWNDSRATAGKDEQSFSTSTQL